jgi:hypothetical protein
MAIQTNPTESWSYTLTTVFVLAAIAIGVALFYYYTR